MANVIIKRNIVFAKDIIWKIGSNHSFLKNLIAVKKNFRKKNNNLFYSFANLDFLIHYVALITISSLVVFLLTCWLCLCCCLRCRRRRKLLDRRRRIRYQLLQENDDDDDRKLKKSRFRFGKNQDSKIVLSESDYNSDEQTLYDKPLLAAKNSINSSGMKHRGLKVSVEDSNGSPMLKNNGQSPVTTDNSLA